MAPILPHRTTKCIATNFNGSNSAINTRGDKNKGKQNKILFTFPSMKVYTDTSVIGGCFDEEFKRWSNDLFSEFISGRKYIVLSDLTLQELEFARQEVREKVKEIPDLHRITIGITDEAIQLAEA
jgi:hypothetical protein